MRWANDRLRCTTPREWGGNTTRYTIEGRLDSRPSKWLLSDTTSVKSGLILGRYTWSPTFPRSPNALRGNSRGGISLARALQSSAAPIWSRGRVLSSLPPHSEDEVVAYVCFAWNPILAADKRKPNVVIPCPEKVFTSG